MQEFCPDVVYLKQFLFGPSLPDEAVGFSFMGAFTGFYDASGKEDEGGDPYIAVAGFAASVASWERFEIDWKLLLARHHLPYFQMSALNALKKPFDDPKWENKYLVRQFLGDANEIIKGAIMLGIGAAVRLSEFNKACIRYDVRKKFNPYALCGMHCVVSADNVLRMKFAHKTAHFFEEGDEGFGLLSDAVHERGINRPERKPGKPHKDKPNVDYYVQLQAADYFAFELRRRVRTIERAIRPSVRNLLKNEIFRVTIYNAKDIEDICPHWGIERIS